LRLGIVSIVDGASRRRGDRADAGLPTSERKKINASPEKTRDLSLPRRRLLLPFSCPRNLIARPEINYIVWKKIRRTRKTPFFPTFYRSKHQEKCTEKLIDRLSSVKRNVCS